MKKAALILLGIVVLLVVAIFAAPALIDFKPRIIAAVHDATGRQLRIDGDLSVSLLPSVKVSASGVHLSNAPGMTAPDMVSVGSVRLEARLFPLLSRRLVIDSLVVSDPAINLEVDKAGHENWSFAPPGAPAAAVAAAPSEGGGAPGLELGDVRIVHGRLTYVDATSGQTVDAKDIELDAQMADLSKPLQVKGKMTLNDEPVTADVAVDSLARLSQAQPAKVKLAIGGKYLQANFDGAAQQRPVPGLDGTFDLDVASVGQLMAWLKMPMDKSRPDPGSLKVHAVFASDGAKASIKEATIKGATLDLRASGSLDASGTTKKIVLDLQSGVLDIDRYLPPQSQQRPPQAAAPQRTPAGPANPFAALSDKPFDLAMLKAADADVKVAIGGVKALGYEIGRVAFTMKATGGVMTADLSELALYGGTAKGNLKLDASGNALGVSTAMRIDRVTLDKLVPGASGALSATLDASARGANPRALAEALSGKASLDLGGVKQAQGTGISGLKLDIDVPGPEKPTGLKASLVYNGEPVTANGTTGPLRALLGGDKFPAKFALASKPITLGYDGTVQRKPAIGLDGTFDLDIPSVGKLASWVGQPLDAKQPDPGPLKAHAVLTTDGSKVALKDTSITGKALKATAEGRIDTSAKPATFDAKLDVQQADLDAYLPPSESSKGAAAPAPAAHPQSEGWSTEPIQLGMLGLANGQAQIHLASTRYHGLEINQGQIVAGISNRVLKITVNKLALAGGTINVAATVDGSGGAAALDYEISVSGAQAQPLLKAFAGTDRLSGTIDYETNGKATGRSEKDLVGALNGTGKFSIKNGAVHGINLAKTLRQAGSLGMAGGGEEKTDFAELSGTYTIKNGIIDNRDMKMLAPLVRLSGNGTVPMPPRTVDYGVTATLVATTEGQGGKDSLAGLPIPVKITGPWSNPSYQVDWKSVFSEMAKDPERLKNMGGDLGKAAKGFGVNIPGAGGGTGGSGGLPGIPGMPQSGTPSTPSTPSPSGTPAAPSSQQKPSSPKMPGLPNPFGK
jgi:AsmA protein